MFKKKVTLHDTDLVSLLDVLVLVACRLLQLGFEDEGVDAAEGVVVGGLATEQSSPPRPQTASPEQRGDLVVALPLLLVLLRPLPLLHGDVHVSQVEVAQRLEVGVERRPQQLVHLAPDLLRPRAVEVDVAPEEPLQLLDHPRPPERVEVVDAAVVTYMKEGSKVRSATRMGHNLETQLRFTFVNRDLVVT